MSTQKVENYKAEKKNRKKILRKQKRERMVARILVGFVCVVLVGWIGWSGYVYLTADKKGTDAENVNVTALDDYVDGLEQVTASPD